MTMTIQSSEDQYYELIESPTGYQLIVLGEVGEQWTDEVLYVFEMAGLHVNLFPWAEIVDLRLQLEIIYYPVIQLWHSGSLRTEFVGYHNESIKNIIELVK
jgi:hypothetical protein